MAFASEKAACVARACRKETDLFKLLVQVRPPLPMTVPVKFILPSLPSCRKKKQTVLRAALPKTLKPLETFSSRKWSETISQKLIPILRITFRYYFQYWVLKSDPASQVLRTVQYH